MNRVRKLVLRLFVQDNSDVTDEALARCVCAGLGENWYQDNKDGSCFIESAVLLQGANVDDCDGERVDPQRFARRRIVVELDAQMPESWTAQDFLNGMFDGLPDAWFDPDDGDSGTWIIGGAVRVQDDCRELLRQAHTMLSHPDVRHLVRGAMGNAARWDGLIRSIKVALADEGKLLGLARGGPEPGGAS